MQWVSLSFTSVVLNVGDIQQYLDMLLVVMVMAGQGVLLASSGKRPGMLLNILQCTRPTPHPKQRISWPRISIVEVEKPQV